MTWHGKSKLFHHYIVGGGDDGKKPMGKVKNQPENDDFDELEECNSFGGALRPDFVDISFDDPELFNTIICIAREKHWKCLALPSPHGGHTYWKKAKRPMSSGSDKLNAIGVKFDIHKGGTYIPLKALGVKRYPPVYGDEYDPDEYDRVPDELLPVESGIDFWRAKDGDSRNSKMFPYIQKLQSTFRWDAEKIRDILSTVNRFIFAEPLDDHEFDTITRDDAFSSPSFYNDKNQFQHDIFGDYIIEKNHVIMMMGQLFIYDGKTYVAGDDQLEKMMIAEMPGIKMSQRREVLAYIRLKAPMMKPADARYISFENGIFDVMSGKMLDHSPEIAIPNHIPWEYHENAYDELVDKTLDRIACGDEDVRMLLEECIGYTFYRRNELRKSFFLVGTKRNGKSTFLDMIKDLLGDQNVSALSLQELNGRFDRIELANRLANIGDDIGDDFMYGDAVATFKKVVAGNRMKGEKKGQDLVMFSPYCKLLFSCNDIPRMRDKTGAVLDRMIIVPFNAVFDKSDPDYSPYLKYDLRERSCMEYMAKIGIDALVSLLQDDGEFTQPASVKASLEEYHAQNDSVYAFCQDVDADVDIVNEPTNEVYVRYTVYCIQNGLQAVGNVAFGKRICTTYNLSSKTSRDKDGKCCRIYTKES